MHFSVIRRITGLFLGLFSLTMLPPVLVSYIYEEHNTMPFIDAFIVIFSVGFLLWLSARRARGELRTRDGFLIAALFWISLGLAGAIPFYMSSLLELSPTDAIFESISGLTTTGATIITGLDNLPKSILFYRQQLQWLGGMGIIVLAVAILPMLGIGGMQLYKTETPGPMKDSKLTPRITETAKALWSIYLGLTVACSLAYWAGGMSLFDAISHSFSTVATGGFSTHDSSLGYFNSSLLNYISIFFMVASGANFALHFKFAQSLKFRVYSENSEIKAYAFILISHVALIFIGFLLLMPQINITYSFEHILFQVTSFATTTGFVSADYTNWPSFTPLLLIFIGFYGGCGGSTAGGMKVSRALILFKQLGKELTHLVHPHSDMPIKLDRHIIPKNVVHAVWGFFSAYILSFGVLMILMMFSGLDQISAFSTVSTTINNVGPGFGAIATDFSNIPDASKWISCFAMLLGRLEIFTLLVLFSPVFWRD